MKNKLSGNIIILIFVYSLKYTFKVTMTISAEITADLNLCNEKGPLPNVIFNTYVHFKNSL